MAKRFAIRLRAVLILAGSLQACTFTGLGDYDVKVCGTPVGISANVQSVGPLASTDLTFVSGADTIGAFPTVVDTGSCAQGVGTTGYLEKSCAFFPNLLPEQPAIVGIEGAYAGVAISTAAPCRQGTVAFQFIGSSVGGSATATCGPGAALPSIAPLATDGSSALVTWYATTYASRADPIQSCGGATTAALRAAIVTMTKASAIIGAPVTLSAVGTSVRAAATTSIPGKEGVILAAPDGNDVSVWSLDSSLTVSVPKSIAGLAGARAVAVASAPDGRLAVVAEIGCLPQSLMLAIGTLDAGFTTTTLVAASAPTTAAVQPSIAWIPSDGDWLVSWIASDGGAHALVRRFDVAGRALGPAINPGVPASGAVVGQDGTLFAYVPESSSFVRASLGCAE